MCRVVAKAGCRPTQAERSGAERSGPERSEPTSNTSIIVSCFIMSKTCFCGLRPAVESSRVHELYVKLSAQRTLNFNNILLSKINFQA